MSRPYIVAVSGGSGSGKTTFARKLKEKLAVDVTIISQDNYYIDQSHRFDYDGGSVNFDHPESIDFLLLSQHLAKLEVGKTIDIPIYEFATHKRKAEHKSIFVSPIIIVDGTLVFNSFECCEQFDLKIYVDAPEEIRYQRRLLRDTVERGRSAEGVKRQFELQVAPMHNQFIEPHKLNVDYLVGIENFEDKVIEVSQFLNKLEGIYG